MMWSFVLVRKIPTLHLLRKHVFSTFSTWVNNKQLTLLKSVSPKNTNANTKEQHCGFPLILKILCTSATDLFF